MLQHSIQPITSLLKSPIQWTDYTWNPFHGCTKISDGCKFCYMYRNEERYKRNPSMLIRSSKPIFYRPYKIKEPSLIFTCSFSDFFHKEADKIRHECWEIIKNTPQHQYQILTKRPERILECLPPDWGNGYLNVWLGVSIESEKYLFRWEKLKKIPAKIKFVSIEPLLENFTKFPDNPDWVIIGGESGNNNGNYRYRPCNLSNNRRLDVIPIPYWDNHQYNNLINLSIENTW
jgi:protein gp37